MFLSEWKRKSNQNDGRQNTGLPLPLPFASHRLYGGSPYKPQGFNLLKEDGAET
jgi:hypothetical protein